ncbi:MAG: ATP-binding protein [Smithellaceae bacterium]|nr:ATP-binding protein [Smithellaceae bacterium]
MVAAMFLDYLRASYIHVLPPIICFFILVTLSLIALLPGKRTRVTILFAAISFLGAIINADVALVSLIPNKATALRMDRAVYYLFVFSPPIYIQFVHSFLVITRRKWLEYLAYLFSLAFLFFVPTKLFVSGFYNYDFGTIAKAGPVFHVFSGVATFTVGYCLVTLFLAMKRTQDNQQRNRIKYIFWGMGLSSLLIALDILPVSGFPVYPMGGFSFIPGLFLAFGVLKYDLLDMGVVLRRGTHYLLLTAALAILYILIIYLFNALFLGAGFEHVVALPVLMALVMVFLFNPLKEGVGVLIDDLFFRGRYNYRKLLKEMSGELASMLRFEEIKDYLLESIVGALQVRHVVLLVRRDGRGAFCSYSAQNRPAETLSSDHAVVVKLEKSGAYLDRERLMDEKDEAVLGLFERLDVVLMVPLRVEKRLLGIIALGQKKSGELFVHEDRELLSTIANQSAVAIENAMRYEKLEELNRDLERKVQEKTAALRRALEEKERTQNQLIQSESLAAIGQLVAGTAHELNNPLASASSLVQTTRETIYSWDVAEDEKNEVLDDLDFTGRELNRAGEIIRSLLGLSRQTQVYVEPVNVNVALDDALRVLHNQYKSLPLVIEKRYDPEIPTVEGNYANIGQLFINVIKNAFQALPDGEGRIVLATSHHDHKGRVVITCSDSGCGLDPQVARNAFKPFYTTKDVGKGTGLGLYISHEIVKRHGGEIKLSGKQGGGAIVTIELPCRRRG